MLCSVLGRKFLLEIWLPLALFFLEQIVSIISRAKKSLKQRLDISFSEMRRKDKQWNSKSKYMTNMRNARISLNYCNGVWRLGRQ